MTVVSISLNEENIQALDSIQEAYGLSGRSEAVRASISAAMSELRELEGIEGEVEGVLVIVRGNHEDPWMARIQGEYADCIRTQLHSHMRTRKCLEVMVVSCPADVFSRMIRDIRSAGKADYVRFVRGRGSSRASPASIRARDGPNHPIKYRSVHVFHGWDASMSDNTPISGSAGPRRGLKKGFGGLFSGTDTAAIKSNISKAGQGIKKSLFQHKAEPTAGCVPGVRELGDDGFERFNVDGQAIFITRRSNDVFGDDEFVDAGSGQFTGRRATSPVQTTAAEVRAPEVCTFYPDFGRSAAPRTFGVKQAPAMEASVAESPCSVPFRENIVPEASVTNETAAPERIAVAIDWSDDDVMISSEQAIDETPEGIPEIPGEAAAEVPEPAPAEAAAGSPEADEAVEPEAQDVFEAPAEPMAEAPSAVAEPEEEIPEIPEIPEEAAAEVPEPVQITVTPVLERIAVPPMDITGMDVEGDAASDAVVSSVEEAVDTASAEASTSAAVEPQAPVAVPAEPAVTEPEDLSAFGIKEMSDPVVSRPRPRYRTYKFSGGRLCDSASAEGRKEEPQRPLD